MSTPAYSIVMPAYNSEETIAEALASVQSQTIDNWEAVVVDDGSTDCTISILRDFSQSDKRIRVFRQANCGPGAARRLALDNCKGEFVAFLDSDDYWESDFLERVDEQFKIRSTEVVFVDVVDEGPDGLVVGETLISRNEGLSKEDVIRRQMTGIIPWGKEKVFKRSLLVGLRGGFSDLDVGEEAIFSFEVVNAAKAVGFVDKPVYHYVKRELGQHKKGGDDPWRQVVRLMGEHLESCGELSLYRTTLNSLALRSLCIAAYRNSCKRVSFREAMSSVASLYKHYAAEFDLDAVDKDALDATSLLIRNLFKVRCYWAIVLASRMRRKQASAKGSLSR